MEMDDAERIKDRADELDAGDPLRRMAAYRLALELVSVAWTDAESTNNDLLSLPEYARSFLWQSRASVDEISAKLERQRQG